MIQLLIIADDLTGAIDTGVQLAKQGIQTRVIPDPQSNYKDLFHSSESTVLVVNTESRHINSTEAAGRLNKIMSLGQAADIRRYFKKTDSTMRGNIGAELEAFKNNIHQDFIGFIPAHPKLKRFTRNGIHYINDTPLHQTAFGSDPLEPITTSDIRTALLCQTKIKIRSVALKRGIQMHPADILVFDCENLDDLSLISEFMESRNCHNAIAGSAAMVELLPKLYALKRVRAAVSDLPSPALLINGSLNKISWEQVRFAFELGFATYSIPSEWINDSETIEQIEKDELFSHIISALQDNHHVILSSTGILTQKFELPKDNLSYEQIPRRLGMIIKSIKQKTGIRSLIVFGGDTLMGIMEKMDCNYIEPQTEILPGVALSLTTMQEDKMYVITKPGGYGEKDVIIRIFNYFNKMRQ